MASKSRTVRRAGEQLARNLIEHRKAVLEHVVLGDMGVSDMAQRKLRQAWVDYLVSVFDPEAMRPPVVSHRGGRYYIVDGQHSVAALKVWLGRDWEHQKVECWVHKNLTEQQEAEMFLKLNDVRQVAAFDKFRTGIAANRKAETEISRALHELGLAISRNTNPGTISCVSTLRKIYERSSVDVVKRAVRIVQRAYGDTAFDAPIVDGIAHLCQRYNGVLNEDDAVKRLGEVRAGARGLLNHAEKLKLRTGSSRASCVAAAAVDVINQGKLGRARLPDWWETQPESAS